MQVYRFDSNGYYVEPVVLNDGDPIPEDCTDIPLPQPNWKPKFVNGEWIETATEEEMNPPILEPEPSALEKQVALMQKALDDLILGGGS